jgi:hypothetical protein
MESPRIHIRGTPERLAQAIAGQIIKLVLDSLDLDELLQKIDLDALLARIDLTALLERIDLNPTLERLDLDAVLAHVDLNALLDHVDLNPLLERIDLNALIAEMDVDALMQRIELEALIAQSTASAGGVVLDVVRRQGVGLDDFVARHVDRLLRKRPNTRPAGPALLVGTATRS